MPESVAWDRVAYTLAALSNETRLRTLLGIREEDPLATIAEAADVSENAIRLQIQELEDRELVYRDSEASYRFQLTPIGLYLSEFAASEGPVIAEAVTYVEEAEAEAREELSPLLSGQELEQAIDQRKRELVRERLLDLLEIED